MDDFDRKFHMFALALGLGDAGNFRVVGEEGKKNYQLLFSTLIKMIEMDENEFFIDKTRKPEIISSLKRTIDFYHTNSPKELQQLIESMKKDDPTNFMIIPAYITSKEYDHVYSLILYQQTDHYVVTMIDKLGKGSDKHSCGAFSKIKKENLNVLCDILFHTKFEYHKKNQCNLSRIIYQLGEGKYGREHLNLTMNEYKGVANCPVIEILGSLKTALFNCQVNIFNHTMDVELKKMRTKEKSIKPKIGEAKAFYNYLYHAFKTENVVHNQALEHAWKYYLERKMEKVNCSKHPTFSEFELTVDFATKFVEDLLTPEAFKISQTTHPVFRVFSSEKSPKLEEKLNKILADWKFSQLSNQQQFSGLLQKINEGKNTVQTTEKTKPLSIQR